MWIKIAFAFGYVGVATLCGLITYGGLVKYGFEPNIAALAVVLVSVNASFFALMFKK